MASGRMRPRLGTLKDFIKKELHVFPGPLVGLSIVFQGVYAVGIRTGVGETVPCPGVYHHVPIEVRDIQCVSKLANVFFVEKRIGIAMGNEDFRFGALGLRTGRQRQCAVKAHHALHVGPAIG